VSRSPARPSGWPPPETAPYGDGEVALRPLAELIADRYFERFPEDLERYGDAARAWEIHDTTHLLNWALLDVRGWADLDEQVRWLAGVLGARDFPLEHLAVNLELAADVAAERVDADVARRLREGSALVRGFGAS
jgi:hypothetical protein